MKYNKTLALVPALLLAACGGDEQTMKPETSPGSVIYSYPADGQKGVSPKADIVLTFSHAVTDEDIADKISIKNDDQQVQYSLNTVNGGKSLKLEPNTPLAVNSRYSVEITEELLGEDGRVLTNPNSKHDSEPGIQFDTRSSFSGSKELANFKKTFEVTNMVPEVGSEFEPMNFSTFRLAMSHPIHPRWRAMGGKIELFDKDNNAVPATVLVKGNRITLDPCLAEDTLLCGSKQDVLEAGETYRLAITDLPSLTAEDTLFSESYQFTPRDTGPTVVLQQTAIDSGIGNGMSEGAATKSILNGQPINGVTLNSVLLGTTDASQQTGDLFAELAYAPAFEANEALPLRIAKGSVLNSTSLDVKVGGKVNVLDAATGQPQKTGNIKVTMLSDASGYMSPNPYTDSTSAPRQITLFMDVSMNAENAQPNAALSQDLLGVELRGIALVRDGVLTIDAIGMVEPNLLGQEYADSTIAFHLEAATDADSALDAEQGIDDLDKTGPKLVSWMPGDKDAIPNTRQSMQRPGDPVILFFDKPLDPDSVADGVSLFGPIMAGGLGTMRVGEGLKAEVDGTALILNPEGGLVQGADYKVFTSGLTGINGKLVDVLQRDFSLDQADDAGSPVTQQSPFALTTYPGYPCVTEGRNLPDNHGYCKDGAGDELPVDNDGNPQTRDILPVTTLPKDRPITVVFSQSMDLESINDETFIVERVDDNGNPLAENKLVAGRLEKNNQRIRFFPNKPWKTGQLYRYKMISEAEGNCTNVICGENGQAFQTSLLVDPTANGGEPLVIYFRGAESVSSVFAPLRNLPIRDTNSNYKIDEFETFDFEKATGRDQDGNLVELEHNVTPPNASRLAMNGNATVLGNDGGKARVGCSYKEEQQCWDKKYIYQTYGLNTEVIGPEKDPETGEPTGNIRVLLYPTMLVTTPAKVWYNLNGPSESNTGPQLLRMRYVEPTEDNPLGLIEGRIVPGEDGEPRFQVTAKLLLDAPTLHLPLQEIELLAHNLYSYPFKLELDGEVTFFDDGRMQIEQWTKNTPEITVDIVGSNGAADAALGLISCLGGIFTQGSIKACEDWVNGEPKAVRLPLKIPPRGVYLNFISNPVKDLPAEQ